MNGLYNKSACVLAPEMNGVNPLAGQLSPQLYDLLQLVSEFIVIDADGEWAYEYNDLHVIHK